MTGTFDIGIAKLAIDIGLCVSLMFLCLKLKKPVLAPQALGKLRALEQTIKGLLVQAEEATMGLTDELLKRRKELEATLLDVKGAEKKLNRDIVNAEEKGNEILRVIKESERLVERAQEAPRARPAPAIQRPVHREPPVTVYDDEEEIITESFHQAPVVAPSYAMHAPATHIPQRRVAPQQTAQPYGFDNEPPSFERKAERAGLSGRVEQRVSPAFNDIQQAATKASQSTNALHAEAIKAALLKKKAEAQNVQTSSRNQREVPVQANDLFLEDEMSIEKPMPRVEERAEDPRLGVLSGIRRQTQVV